MVPHRNVVNFFAGMDARVGAQRRATWLAVTSISFDISVLELLWTLARGFKVVRAGRAGRARRRSAPQRRPRRRKPLDFSLFYFAAMTREQERRTATACCSRARGSPTATASRRCGRPSATSTPSAGSIPTPP